MTTTVQSSSLLLANLTGSTSSVAANTSSTTSSGTTSSGTASSMSTMFTQLLVAQIKNQDPTSPTDPSTYVNQLAQLSQTESLQTVSQLTASNAGLLQSLQVLAMGSQVGSTLMATSDSVTLGTSAVSGSLTLASATTKTDLVLTGTDGRKHAVSLGAHGAGEVPFSLDPTALGLPAGRYGIAVETDAGSTTGAQIAGVLSSVNVSATGATTLVMTNLGDVLPSAVTRFQGVTTP
jgi:flagellar basal-body rod modification protein FlgD